MASREDTAGIIFPPPLLYLGGFLLGVALDWGLALQRLPRPPAVMVLGGLLVLLSLLLWFSSIRTLRRANTQVNPFKPTTALVTSGPFQRSRNPIYVGMTLLFVGLALLLGRLGPLVLLIPILALIQFGVVAREERYLGRKFGEAYASYRGQVRRWL